MRRRWRLEKIDCRRYEKAKPYFPPFSGHLLQLRAYIFAVEVSPARSTNSPSARAFVDGRKEGFGRLFSRSAELGFLSWSAAVQVNISIWAILITALSSRSILYQFSMLRKYADQGVGQAGFLLHVTSPPENRGIRGSLGQGLLQSCPGGGILFVWASLYGEAAGLHAKRPRNCRFPPSATRGKYQAVV